jgi:hypothetical protein
MSDGTSVAALSPSEARVLGSLMEKQLTTPDVYPLSLSALTVACNQSTNRHPVMGLSPAEVERAVLELKGRRLARIVHPGAGERVTKYRQVADEVLGLDPGARAVLCSLLVRGAQTVAELKSRTERLHRFDSVAAVESALVDLARREPPLAARVERPDGRREPRWLQLLEAGAEERAAAPATAVADLRRGAGDDGGLERRVAALEARVTRLVEALGDLVDLDDPADGGEGSPARPGRHG